MAGEPRPVPTEPPVGELLCHVQYENGGAAHARTPHGYIMRYFRTAEFELSRDLTRITSHSDPEAPADLVPELLVASIPAFVRLLSGHAVLHASAVAKNGKALGILAQSGGGKSTIAAALCIQGFSMVTDDVLTLDWRDETPWVRAGPAELRLRPGSIALDAFSDCSRRRQTVDGRTAVSPEVPLQGPVSLAALLLPVLDRASNTVMLSRLGINEALTAILAHLRVVGWKDGEVLQRIFPEQALLARRVPVYRLTLPWGAQGLPEVGAILLSLVG